MRKSLTVLALAGASVMIGGSAVAAPPLHAQMNHASYWEGVYGMDCYKIDDYERKSFTLDHDASVVILKAGSGAMANDVYDAEAGYMAGDVFMHVTGKGISHVIVCGDGGYEPPPPPS